MRRAVTISVLLVALAGPAGADAACADKGDKTIGRNSQAVLVQTPAKARYADEADCYACLAGSSERIDVTDHSTTSAVTTPVLAGHFVALHAYVFPSPDDEAQSMDIVDLRRGDEHFSAATPASRRRRLPACWTATSTSTGGRCASPAAG